MANDLQPVQRYRRLELPLSRRELLRRGGMGLGMLGLSALLGDEDARAAAGYANPMAPKKAHFAAKAKHVIHIFANGGPSHVDTFDPKPMLTKLGGKKLPMENLRTERKTGVAFPSPYKFKKHGQSGLEVSKIFPNVARHVDEMAVIRSMHADVPNHEPSLLLMNCGESQFGASQHGQSWTTYGLGTENQNLPGFIAMCPGGYPIKETQNWQAAFLPGDLIRARTSTLKHTDIEKLHGQRRRITICRLRRASAGSIDLLALKLNRQTSRRASDSISRSRGARFNHSSWPIACRWKRRMHST